MYDTPRAALIELTNYVRFESVAIQVLRVQHPELRITAPTADLGRDAYGRPLFGEHDEIVGLFSCQRRWRRKLREDLQPYSQCPPEKKPEKVFFVTNQPITEDSKENFKQEVYDRYQIPLEIVALDELDLALKSDPLHRVAEHELGVRPRQPRVLQPPAAF
ncbi:MAG: restriction endonuclease [Actinobacteria bacterium]|nr:restriction endonuclease [Actinomycetota bacterium]